MQEKDIQAAARRGSNTFFSVGGALAILLIAVPLWAEDPAPAASAPQSATTLPSLPLAPRLELPPATPEELETLDGILLRLLSPREEERRSAAAELRALPPKFIPALSRRLKGLADKSDKEAMKALLPKARQQAREELKEELRDEGHKGKTPALDTLDALVAQGPKAAGPKDAKSWQDLTSVIGISRALSGIGTIEATRELIEIYTRFGEFLRIDTQNSLAKLQDRGLAALIEARRHKAEKVARWAEKQLDSLGKAIPSEAVQTTDYEVLADILRAYGRVKDPDAARIVVSFANTERAQVRDAARQAVALMGDVGNWQVRDAYENVVGKRPPRDWTWDRTARELFATFDRLRLAQVHQLFDQGVAAQRSGKLAEMRRAFDQLLTRSPTFERRGEMAEGYFAFAKEVATSDPPAAIDALRRAERLSTTDVLRANTHSLRLALEAEALLGKGIVDRELIRRAIDLDPSGSHADQLRLATASLPQETQVTSQRWRIAGVIGASALLGMIIIALLPRILRRPAPGPGQPAATKPASDASGEPDK